MRRAIAIAALISLVAGPASAWQAYGCCGDADCCKSGICPMRARHGFPQKSEEEMHCHHAASAPEPASKCSTGAQCTGRAHPLHPAPLPRGVLSAAAAAPAPAETVFTPAAAPTAAIRGFVSPPFEPPRLSA